MHIWEDSFSNPVVNSNPGFAPCVLSDILFTIENPIIFILFNLDEKSSD